MTSIKDVLDNHLQCFRQGNLEGILADYAPDAILFTPAGPLKGRSEIKTLFQTLFAEFGEPGSSMTLHMATIEGDYAYIIWSGETADNAYEFATDTFFVRDGKIAVQSHAAQLSPKR